MTPKASIEPGPQLVEVRRRLNPKPPVSKPANSDLDGAKDLLLWARREQIALSHVQIGAVSIVVTVDHKMIEARIAPDGEPRAEARLSIIEQFGGALLNQPDESAGEDDTVEPTEEDD